MLEDSGEEAPGFEFDFFIIGVEAFEPDFFGARDFAENIWDAQAAFFH